MPPEGTVTFLFTDIEGSTQLWEKQPDTMRLALARHDALMRTAIDANDGVRPWIEHFYLAHGVGTESAEMPLIGTDLGERFDERLVMQPGMVLVFEPVIWEDGFAGYRSEDIVAVTDTGWAKLSGSTYEPYGVEA